jgi:hypothetical protein
VNARGVTQIKLKKSTRKLIGEKNITQRSFLLLPVSDTRTYVMEEIIVLDRPIDIFE